MSVQPDTIYLDLDGTLCPLRREGEAYADLLPIEPVVERVRQAKTEGLRVVVHTARNVRTYQGDMSKLVALTAPSVLAWLRRHDIPFDGLLVGKPWPGPKGFYVDDRSVRPDEFVRLDSAEIHARLMGADRGG